MRRAPDLARALALLGTLTAVGAAEPAPEPAAKGRLFDAGALGNRKEPIVVTSDTLEYDYKSNVVVYRGGVQATQGDVKLRSDTLTVTLGSEGRGAEAVNGVADRRGGRRGPQEIVAAGNVRIDDGTRWATGGRAVFDQAQRTLVLTEGPMLHDGSNEVAGDRVIVYLDEDRSVVEGGRKRVKAVLYPDDDGAAPSGGRHSAAPAGEPAGPTAKAPGP
jgi:lipopolysaccharide export system protein LptA